MLVPGHICNSGCYALGHGSKHITTRLEALWQEYTVGDRSASSMLSAGSQLICPRQDNQEQWFVIFVPNCLFLLNVIRYEWLCIDHVYILIICECVCMYESCIVCILMNVSLHKNYINKVLCYLFYVLINVDLHTNYIMTYVCLVCIWCVPKYHKSITRIKPPFT